MNLGQAVAVCLYELVRNARAVNAQQAKLKSASAGDVEQITLLLLEVLESSGYVNPKTAASTADKTRRLVRRLSVTDRDAAVLLGMLRQVLWKVRGSSK
jgi:tRNA C32,U32 (ribose-2'-O)-methylase TrmJ